MKIHQIRNATLVCELAGHRILVDPMLGQRFAHPPLRLFSHCSRNPVVDLPSEAAALLDTVTHCLITHCQRGHFDHLDRPGAKWLRERGIPVICTPHDARYLARQGLNVEPLAAVPGEPEGWLGGTVTTVRCTHGLGLIGGFMEHGVGYFLQMPGEPSLYLAGDTVLTDTVRDFVLQHQPQVSVIPAGGAQLDIGSEIIMGIDEALQFAQLATGQVVANHLEALNHCPVTRRELAARAEQVGLGERLHIPADGQALAFNYPVSRQVPPVWQASAAAPPAPCRTRGSVAP